MWRAVCVHSLSDRVSYWEHSRGLGSSSQVRGWVWPCGGADVPCCVGEGEGPDIIPLGRRICMVRGLQGNGGGPERRNHKKKMSENILNTSNVQYHSVGFCNFTKHCLLCSPSLHLLYHKYSKKSHFEILQFKIAFLFKRILKYNLFLWCQSWIYMILHKSF